jgi:CheY-like chemotaxis protein
MGAGVETVLVVDDDHDVRAALVELLETEGYDVVAAANGRVALARLRAGVRPCAIVLDLMMPIMDGWEFRAAQLGDADLRDIPVIILSAAGLSEEIVRAQLDPLAYVPKPPPTEGLLAAISRCVHSVAHSGVANSL